MSKEIVRKSVPFAATYSVNNYLTQPDKLRTTANGSPGDPALGFDSEPTIGWYLNDNSEVAFTIGHADTILQGINSVEFKTPILINNCEPSVILETDKGCLYKKANHPGLWWKTKTSNVDITKINDTDLKNLVDLIVGKLSIDILAVKNECTKQLINTFDSIKEESDIYNKAISQTINTLYDKLAQNDTIIQQHAILLSENKVNEVAEQDNAQITGYVADQISKVNEQVTEQISKVNEQITEQISKVNEQVNEQITEQISKVNEQVNEQITEQISKVNEQVAEKINCLSTLIDEKLTEVSEKMQFAEQLTNQLTNHSTVTDLTDLTVQFNNNLLTLKNEMLTHVNSLTEQYNELSNDLGEKLSNKLDHDNFEQLSNKITQQYTEQLCTDLTNLTVQFNNNLLTMKNEMLTHVNSLTEQTGSDLTVQFNTNLATEKAEMLAHLNSLSELYSKLEEKSNVQFPLIAGDNSDTPAYSFADGNVGVGMQNGKLMLQNKYGSTVVDIDGSIVTPSIATTNIISGSDLQITTTQKLSINSDSLLINSVVHNNVKDKIAYGIYVDNAYNEVGDDRSTNIHGLHTEQNLIGLGSYNNQLELTTGSSSVLISDHCFNVGDRFIAFKDANANASLLVDNGALLFNSGGHTYNLTQEPKKYYDGHLSYLAGSPIRTNDIVCMDPSGNGLVHNALGGTIKNIDMLFDGTNNKVMEVFNSVDVNGCNTVILVTYTNNVVTFYTMNLLTYTPTVIYTHVTNLSITYCKILQLSSAKYAIVQLDSDANKIIVDCVYPLLATLKSTKHEITLDAEYCAMTVEYDEHNDLCVVVCYSTVLQNFTVVLFKHNDTFELGTYYTTKLTALPFSDVVEQIHLLLIPGGSCVVSYGNCKLVFIINSLLGDITFGDLFLDYDSVDCADMLYDQNNGLVLTLEKTVSNSCYIQVIDVLGLSIQKVCSRTFRCSNVVPLGIAYNASLDTYVVLYTDDGCTYVQQFDFTNVTITLGLRFASTTSKAITSELTSELALKHEKSIFAVSDCSFIYWVDSQISCFSYGLHGNPHGYIGVAMNAANTGDECQIMVKGHIYNASIPLPSTYIGKKLYLHDAYKEYPFSLSTAAANGIFIGTCLDAYRILIGL